MTRSLIAFGAGLLFGLGLIVSGMTNPAKVLNFLDVFGNWDPSLAFVMGGGLLVNLIGFRTLVMPRRAPLFATEFSLPTLKNIDRDLVVGTGLFGIGWGLVGLCPGPAMTATVLAPASVLPFVAAMLVGMRLKDWISTRSAAAKPALADG